MSYGFQIKKRNPATNEHEWLWVRTSSGYVYSYKTEQEAYDMMKMCYPDQIVGDEVRVAQQP